MNNKSNNHSLKALLIAGGKGFRLKSSAIPKPLIKIAGMPILERQIELLKRYNISDIYILTGYLGDQIKDYFQDGRQFGVSIKYSQEKFPLGTSGCVKLLDAQLRDAPFFVIYGDLVLNINIDKLFAYHVANLGDATIVVHPNNHPYDSDIVEMDDDFNVSALYTKDKKPQFYSNLVSAAVYMLNPIVLDYIHENKPSDFVRDVFINMLRDNKKIVGYKTIEYIKDVGTIDRFNKVEQDILDGKVYDENIDKLHPAIFLDRDGTIIKHINQLHKPSDLELYPDAPAAIKLINNSNFLVFIATNQSVVARNLCNIETVHLINKKLQTLLGDQGAYLDDIFFCPHHPDKGFPEENPAYKINCNCRKPKDGMIRNAMNLYNIDIASSWFIGDSTIDIKTGKDSGMSTILLQTGLSGKDNTYDVTPDYQFNNLTDAVNFIIESSKKYKELSDKLYDMIKDKNRIFVIAIGGLSRSGKSTFARFLCDDLLSKGINTKVIKLDNWLLSKDQRTDSMTVRERYRYDDIKKDIRLLLEGAEISMSIYDPYNQNIRDTVPFSLEDRDCIIIEGVLSLDIKYLVELADVKIYVSLDEEVRRRRYFDFYRWKDISEDEIELLYDRREIDETQIVIDSMKFADIIINNHEWGNSIINFNDSKPDYNREL
ncbi:MAG: HAD-IIIA family hydrolase [Nitrospirae bacterium]|nr:HAD-IIIA family hydrolase [Nitrospirota bacterium]